MYFVKNFINKFSRKDRKDSINFSKKWWDSKHVMTNEEKCKVRGHDWEFNKATGIEKAVCRRCKTSFNTFEDGTIS